ncbi:hypothetical protein F2P81_007766 [Scophthalmus maximus]|uniref:Uncharacterized protein n=1 Tax=Scophthalmus maximus TaxID=52904 RepID=A0A6A4T8Z1_SCOMX|nr:hypothetical protein F2P81_007766 [Scophthalmus maximus]
MITPLAAFMIRSLQPPGSVHPSIPSCSAVDSCEGGDILRHKPAGCCSLDPIFPFYIFNPVLSGYIKLHDFRPARLLRLDSGVQLILIPIAKALRCIVRSRYGRSMQSYISYTGDYSIFDSYSCSRFPRNV